MNDDQNKPGTSQGGEIVLTTVPGETPNPAHNETPTDRLARLQQQEDSQIEPDNEDG